LMGEIGDEMRVKPSERQEYYCKLAVVGPIKWKLCWLQSILVKEAGFEPGFRTGIKYLFISWL
ncbi:MAG: hypothetical protein WAO22_07730, partial [bacterium]